VTALGGSQALWFVSRGSGLALLVAFSAVVVLGVAARPGSAPRRWTTLARGELHRTLALFCVAFLGLHVPTAILDRYVTIGWAAAVVPFASPYRTLAIGLGALAVDSAAAVLITSLARQRLGYRAWRPVHWLAYLAWPAAFMHAVTAGPDLRIWWITLTEGGCAGRSQPPSWPACWSGREASSANCRPCPKAPEGSADDVGRRQLRTHHRAGRYPPARYAAVPAAWLSYGRPGRPGWSSGQVRAVTLRARPPAPAGADCGGRPGRAHRPGRRRVPAAAKLAAVAAGRAPVVIANGTEGEPASAKDKVLMARSPHLVLDGAVLAAELVGARDAVVVVHHRVREIMDAAAAERHRARLDRVRVTIRTAADRFAGGEASAEDLRSPQSARHRGSQARSGL
jgi:methionine sulfoxide reductase heme-binding subunit